MGRRRLRKQSRKHHRRKKQQPTSRTPKQQTPRNAPNSTQNLRRQNILFPSHASRSTFGTYFATPTKTISTQTTKPKTTKNPLPHLPILERHHTLPRNQRHVLRHAALRPQKHQKHSTLRPTRRSTLPRRIRLHLKSR